MSRSLIYRWRVIIAAIIYLSIPTLSSAFEVDTHQVMNDYITRNTLNGFSLDTYLKTEIGLQEGIETVINTRSILKWVGIGGRYEDLPPWTPPYIRSANHFHDPLTEGGFTGIWGSGFLNGQSSTQWALAPQRTQTPGGYYSWNDVREYYFKALTETESETRKIHFAQTFRGLGQLMHLVQDVSVPAHSRDDGHYNPFHIFSDYEEWVAESGSPFISNSDPVFFSGTIDNIASFIDTNQYHNPFPNPDLTISTTVGLSEYSNANFFSEGTILNGNFPYPAWSNMDEYDADVGSGKKRTYLRKLGDGQRIEHVATGGWFYKRLPEGTKHWGLSLDDLVYSDYATLLIPRAVGYSAGLLNYFFRGTLGAEGTSNAIRITNHSNEEMNGIFTLYYDNDNAERHPVGNASWNLSLPANSRSDELTFEIPPDARDAGRYMLVFRGTMGAESDAVVGRLVQLPQPYVFIVQDTASLGAPVITDLGLLDRGTEAPDQVLSGHFVAHGRMIRISLISSCLGCAPLRLLINGHERPNASWMEGDTPTQPVTWQVTNIPQGRSYEIIMRVDVTDGANSAYFLQHLLHYTGLGNGAFPVIQHKAVGDYVIQKSTELTIERPVFAQLFPLESRHGHWRVVQMAGHRPEDECATSGGTSGCEAPSEACNRYGVAGHVSVDEEFITEITLDTLDPAWKYTHSWQCNLTDTLPVSYSELLSTEEFLPLTITAELIKEYTPEDLKYFESIGIAPVYYSVIFE